MWDTVSANCATLVSVSPKPAVNAVLETEAVLLTDLDKIVLHYV